jgi:hypothetical protein
VQMGIPAKLRAPEELPAVKKRGVTWFGCNQVQGRQVSKRR